MNPDVDHSVESLLEAVNEAWRAGDRERTSALLQVALVWDNTEEFFDNCIKLEQEENGND